VWAPSGGVLARVASPRIRTLDSSQTPKREAQASTPRALAAVDLSAFRAALVGMARDAPEAPATPAPPGHAEASELERRLQQRDVELTTARVQLARIEAEAAEMRARLDRAARLDGPATLGR